MSYPGNRNNLAPEAGVADSEEYFQAFANDDDPQQHVMSQDKVLSPEARAKKQLEFLRGLTPFQYIASTTLESLATAVVLTPPLFFFYALDGLYVNSFLRAKRAEAPSFGKLALRIAKHASNYSVRSLVWFPLTQLLISGAHEQLKLGIRYRDGGAPYSPFINVASGALTAWLLTADWARAGPRAIVNRRVLTAFAGVVGFYLPAIRSFCSGRAQVSTERLKNRLGLN